MASLAFSFATPAAASAAATTAIAGDADWDFDFLIDDAFDRDLDLFYHDLFDLHFHFLDDVLVDDLLNRNLFDDDLLDLDLYLFHDLDGNFLDHFLGDDFLDRHFLSHFFRHGLDLGIFGDLYRFRQTIGSFRQRAGALLQSFCRRREITIRIAHEKRFVSQDRV